MINRTFNDSEFELKAIAKFLSGISKDIPWHVTAFHQDYKMSDRSATQAEALVRAAEIGLEGGLRFVYAGNLPGRVGDFENTYCPDCHEMLIRRHGFQVLENKVSGGACPNCSASIAGCWN